MSNFTSLENVLGNSPATEPTVALFNSARPVNKDEKGKYILVAISPYLNGVITEKQYL